MEEGASEDGDRAQARQKFRNKMTRMSYFIKRQANPETAVDMSMVPPHQANRY